MATTIQQRGNLSVDGQNIHVEFVATESATAPRNGAGFHPCQGLYYSPSDQPVHTAFIAAHYNVDFSEHYLAPLMAARGYGFLGWNTRFRGNEGFFLLEHALIDLAAGMRWLKETAAVERIIILGNSGGGSLMAAYQSQSHGVTMHATPGLKLPAALNDLPSADFYISLCAHQGRPEVLTDWFDPAITDETDPISVDPELDMYNPLNGPAYSEEFILRYRQAQVARNHRITDWCHSELKRLIDSGYRDRAFNLYRTWADLRLLDGSIDPSERIIGRCYAGDPRAANYSPRGIGLTNTLRTWLSMWSLRDSCCRGGEHLARIHEPALVIQSDADTGVFPSDARTIYDGLAAKDKTLSMISGDHYLQDPADARTVAAELISEWLKERL
jgi:hypothetical protein